jgi:uncharacterized protein (TIRG00374 family)
MPPTETRREVTSSPSGGRESLGDRVERAIEDRTDAERELRRAEVEQARGLTLGRTAFWLAVTGISLYLVTPSLIEVIGSGRDLEQIDPIWFPAMAVLQIAALACLWMLQRIALGQPAWGPVVSSQLAGNSLAKVAPGGGALGAALQYRMLVRAGLRPRRTVSGLTAANLMTFSVVLALPVLAIPAIIRGADRTLVEAAVIGFGVFLLLLALSALLLVFDRPLLGLGRLIQRLRNRLRRRSMRLSRLPERLLRERQRILATLGPRWKAALLATTGRWAFDYATLLAALAAVGAHPRPGLVLLAFCAAQLLAQVPVTPGGLGFVEAGLTAMLGLAGVAAGDAVLATFAYRLFSYWLPLPAGAVALFVHRRHSEPTGADGQRRGGG